MDLLAVDKHDGQTTLSTMQRTRVYAHMTPEQKIRQQLTNTLKRILPKGRYVLQPIETNQVGVPDFYFMFNGHAMWFETKTVDYRLDPYQYNWASTHAKAGGRCFVVTRLPPTKTSPQPPTKPALGQPTTAHQQPQPHPPTPTHPHTKPSTPTGLHLLPFDAKMLDYSTLGAYIKKERPSLSALEDLLDSLR